jgi:hypothetical protein
MKIKVKDSDKTIRVNHVTDGEFVFSVWENDDILLEAVDLTRQQADKLAVIIVKQNGISHGLRKLI